MSVSWKAVLIGSEVTVLVAVAGVGVHLAVRPHNSAVPPPPMVLPLPAATPPPGAVIASPSPSTPATPTAARGLAPESLAALGREDRRQMNAQWEVLRRLIKAMERYMETRVIPDLERSR